MSPTYFQDVTKQYLIGLYFLNIFPIGNLISLWSRGFTIFQGRIRRWLLSNDKVINTCEDKKRRQVVPVLK